MASLASGLLALILPKKKAPAGGTSFTSTYRPTATGAWLPQPGGRDHIIDLFASRAAQDAPTLLKSLFQQDPDVSAAVNAFLTVADVEPYWVVRDPTGAISRDGHVMLTQVMAALFSRSDYTQPANFQLKESLRALCANFRYMALLRGALAAELVLDKAALPSEIRSVDYHSLLWTEIKPGVYLPQQKPTSGGTYIDLNIPTFFISHFRRDPTDIYANSFFVSSINTIAARQQVINDLYRIMRIVGYPRIEISLMEEVLRKNAPADCKTDEIKMMTWLEARRSELTQVLSGLRADQAFVHFDSVESKIMNDSKPGATLDITAIIETLNAQNQAALKVMGTVIGRGEAGVNTASIEARIFALNAEQLNVPIADLLSQIFTLAIRLNGIEATVEFCFEKIELRPMLELEPQLTMKQTRYLQLLSLGIISDDDFSIELFNRISPDGSTKLSGTNFMAPAPAVDTSGVSPNQDPLGRSITPQAGKPGGAPPKKPAVAASVVHVTINNPSSKSRERTTVTAHDDEGRIKTFEREEITEDG